MHHRRAHYLPLDSLRGIAALSVVIHHFVISQSFSALFPDKAWIDTPFFHNAWMFVDLFFVLSGIVISLSYVQSEFGKFPFGEFVIRRLARIYPLHIATLFAFLLFRLIKLGLIASGGAHFVPAEAPVNNAYSFVINLLLLHALGFVPYLSWNGPSWSISAEFYTYLVFGVVVVVAQRFADLRALRAMSAALVVASLAAILFVLNKRSMDFHYDFGIVRCIFSFFIGVLTAAVATSLPPQQRRGAAWNTVQIGSAVAVVVVVGEVGVVPALGFVAPFAFAVLLGSLMAYPGGALPRLLSRAPLIWLGKRSYSIYMVHAFVLVLMEYAARALGVARLATLDRILPGTGATLAIAVLVAAVLVLSDVTFKWIEVPGSGAVLKLINRAPVNLVAPAERGAVRQ